LDVPILIIEKEHGVEGDSGPRMNSLKMIGFMCPTGIYFLNKPKFRREIKTNACCIKFELKKKDKQKSSPVRRRVRRGPIC